MECPRSESRSRPPHRRRARPDCMIEGRAFVIRPYGKMGSGNGLIGNNRSEGNSGRLKPHPTHGTLLTNQRPPRCLRLLNHPALFGQFSVLSSPYRRATGHSLSSLIGTLLSTQAILATGRPPYCLALCGLPVFSRQICVLSGACCPLARRCPWSCVDSLASSPGLVSTPWLLNILLTVWRPSHCLSPSFPYVAFLIVCHCILA